MKTKSNKIVQKKAVVVSIICFLLLCLMNVYVYAADEVTSSVYKIEDLYISKIRGKTTAKEFKQNISTDQEVVVANKKGKVLADTANVTTDSILTVGNTKYTLIVRGDIDGNGLVNSVDLSKAKLCQTGKLKLTESAKRACDIDGDGEITIKDVERIQSIILGVDINDDFSISNVKTYNTEAETNIFAKNENIIIRFNDSNIGYYAEKLKVNGKEYSVSKKDDGTYEIIFNSFSEFGNKTITIEEATLNNGQKAEINETINVTVLKDKPEIHSLYCEETENTVNVSFTVKADDFETIDGILTITDEYGNDVKTHDLVIGENELTFDKSLTVEYYYFKFIVTYHDGNENYENETIKEEKIYVNGRAIEMKDIMAVKLYKKTDERVVEVSNFNISDLDNLTDYIVKIEMKDIKSFFTTIKEYKEENGKLIFVLNYQNIVQYNGDEKINRLEVEFGNIEDGAVTRVSLESLIEMINENPGGDFVITSDLDATKFTSGTSIITTEFTGTIDFTGHKITNLSRPLFTSLNGATIKNLVIENVSLGSSTSLGTIANTAVNPNLKNVHIKKINIATKANATAGFIGTVTGGTIEECSVTNLNITTSGHVRVSGIVGYMGGGTIKNCYVQGTVTSNQSKDGNGIGSILGHATGANKVTIENCIADVEYTWTGGGVRFNGGIIGLSQSTNTILKNNISLCTGTGLYKVNGSGIDKTSVNNYELEESTSTSNASGEVVKVVAADDITTEFFRDTINFDEEIWDLEDVSYENLPTLKNSDPNNKLNKEDVYDNTSIYIPDYSRIKKLDGYDDAKEVIYSNLYKLMPYYDAKYLVEDGANISVNDVLNTKIVKYVLPYDTNNKLITYLVEGDDQKIASIKVVFDDYTTADYEVSYNRTIGNIAIYKMAGTQIPYGYNNYVINQNSSIVNTIAEAIQNYDYTNDLDPLTSAEDSRLYKDHYNDTMKARATEIAIQILENEDDSLLTADSEILEEKIKNELIDDGRLKDLIYGYNYLYRWYNFEIGGANISDLLLFHGKMYSDNMTMSALAREVLTGSYGTNATGNFFANSLKEYTGSSTVAYYLDGVIKNIGGYEDVNDWFTEYFSSRNLISEIPLTNHPEVEYRAWYNLKRYSNYILPIITLPEYAGYVQSGPVHFQVGSQRTYYQYPQNNQGALKNKLAQHSEYIRRYFDTLADSYDVGRWNNYCIMCFDQCRVIAGTKPGWIPGTTEIVIEQCKKGTSDPFHKNFNEAINMFYNVSDHVGGVGSTAGNLKFGAKKGIEPNDFDTWSHEFQHALADKIMLHQKGMRMPMEAYTQGVVEQNASWSRNDLSSGFDYGALYFNLIYTLGKESMSTQNLTPERINTREKLENYYKGQQDTIDLLDYIEAKAFISLTPEQQAKITTQITETGNRATWAKVSDVEVIKEMNLTTLEALWDNKVMLRPAHAWGGSVRGGNVTSVGGDDYGFESAWVTRWYIPHNDTSYPNAFAQKRNLFEMLGYGGVDGFITYGSRLSKNDLDAIQKITLAKTGTAMNWKEYKFSRYEEIESKLDNKYINADLMLEQFTKALINDAANSNGDLANSTNLRKTYYHYLKRATDDFIADPLGTDLEVVHITSAQELVEKINARPYGYFILDNDIDFSGMTTNVTQTFMGKLDGNGHKITGNTFSIFKKIRFGYVKDLVIEDTVIPRNITNQGALSATTQYSLFENITVKNANMSFAGRNDLSLIGGACSVVTGANCSATILENSIQSMEDFINLENDLGGIYVLETDLDFSDYEATGSVITGTFTGKIIGNGHTISNLTNASLFNQFNGTIENVNIRNFTNTSTGDWVAAFAINTNTATIRNIKFEDITLQGRNSVAVLSALDKSNSVFENISVKNANITASGVYASALVGRKYGGKINNVYVDGNISVTAVANGGIAGSTETNVAITNVISKVNIERTADSENKARKQNGCIVGHPTSNTTRISNSIALGNMTGYQEDMVPYKFMFDDQSWINTMFTKCYECSDVTGKSLVTENTAGHLDTISNENLNEEFYRGLGFNEEIWDFSQIASKGCPELK